LSGDVLLEAMWVSVRVVIDTFIGYALGAAGPAFALILAIGTGYAIFKVIFEDDWHEHDDDDEDYDESGASDEGRDFWKDHPDTVEK